jgi:hypothetical protein
MVATAARATPVRAVSAALTLRAWMNAGWCRAQRVLRAPMVNTALAAAVVARAQATL